ncbi:MAG: alpha/beta fold hydrolase [Deltaproteobacteria bacterium]|nr:alpha/beta fold hydrolase [Deltaproteobacteria bacterium]MBW1923715.1 alpha/beta fold hydrolase [Deltaproteobacteria bacterium]MBW2008490.1 alpha/beta fold hydrolase [Deltaproteobacteria bacterium]MBW2347731.1 alpha/beta fold hydrolase [Deltaproteobacteria bacterium]
MPYANVNGAEIYYEIHGEGYPLLLIRGLGSNADHWYPQVPAFSRRYRVIVFDNRGIARSRDPGGSFTIGTMADDALGLLEALSIPRAHVAALSMGGMIAQVLALSHPERLNGLVLACTHCGGEHAVRPSDDVRALMGRYIATASPEDAARAAPCLFTRKTLEEAQHLLRPYLEASARYRPSAEILQKQWTAIQGHDTWAGLPRIQAPTLVLTGDEDVLVPPENTKILAQRIPGAEALVIPGGAHQFLVERAEASNRAVLEFLDSVDTGKMERQG